MAIFSKVAPIIIDLEGKYSDRKNDRGGETKYGISKLQYPHLDIANLTEEKALQILDADYWEHYKLGDLNSQSVANQCFFLLVNEDPVTATTIIQNAINAVGRSIVRVKVDGVFGGETRNAINMLVEGWLGDRIRVEAARHYLEIVDGNRSQEEFFVGWIRRALS